jgi:hypothetical protein
MLQQRSKTLFDRRPFFTSLTIAAKVLVQSEQSNQRKVSAPSHGKLLRRWRGLGHPSAKRMNIKSYEEGPTKSATTRQMLGIDMLSHWAAFINLWDNLAFVPMLTLSAFTLIESHEIGGLIENPARKPVFLIQRTQLIAFYALFI